MTSQRLAYGYIKLDYRWHRFVGDFNSMFGIDFILDKGSFACDYVQFLWHGAQEDKRTCISYIHI